jgi:mannobiose 2-epimerase
MKSEIKQHLLTQTLPFWNALADRENGGFYGYVSHSGEVDRTYPKGIVLHLRILWFYSQCSIVLKDPHCLEMARHCYDFVVKHFVDRKYSGLYWLVSPKGTPVDTRKHGYSHAFCAYAMSAYYEASGDERALRLALEASDVIALAASYTEVCSRDWKPLPSIKTTGAFLHYIEANTALYRVCDESDAPKILTRLTKLLTLFHDKMYDGRGRLPEEFDADMNQISDVYSHGHFLEAAWLINHTLDVVGGDALGELYDNLREMCHALVVSADEIPNVPKAWWTYAEALIAHADAFRRDGRAESEKAEHLRRAEALWDFIKSRLIDSASGEWFNELDENDLPDHEMPLAGMWKCPYHNGRMALWAIENL